MIRVKIKKPTEAEMSGKEEKFENFTYLDV